MPDPRATHAQPRTPKTEVPPQAGEVANLTITATNRAGAILEWNLFLPWKEVRHEQRRLIKVGEKALVFLFYDDDNHLAASTRLGDFLVDEAEGLQEGDRVDLFVGDRTDLGVKVIVNHRFWGMVHTSDIFGKLSRGEARVGYIKALRADRKLDVALTAPGYAKVDDIAQNLLDLLKRRGGFLPLTDKSKPEAIYALCGISKKAFKLTLGNLYKNRQILLEPNGIRLVTPSTP